MIVSVEIPAVILESMALGRITALRKPQGGVRGIVCRDFLRRVIARTLAQQYGAEIEQACAPFQYALSTRAGTESVAHALQASTALDASLTVLSIDGISAFDSISRASMLQGLHALPGASAALNFVRSFYGRTSQYLCTDDGGTTHDIWQAEGGEQGDPLMPMLYALGQHPALVELQSLLQDDEKIYAFLDDIYITCQPQRVRHIFDLLVTCLWNHARVRVHQGKTKIWNKSGIVPPDVENMRDSRGNSAWRGDHSLPTREQGLKILGTPLGHPDFVSHQLQELQQEHDLLLQRIPGVPDLQAAWLLLSYCAASRANYYLRALTPTDSLIFANLHDESLWSCLCTLLGIDPANASAAAEVATLPLRMGGLGLRSAARTRHAASWASWADTIPMIRQRNPSTAEGILAALNGSTREMPSVFQELTACR